MNRNLLIGAIVVILLGAGSLYLLNRGNSQNETGLKEQKPAVATSAQSQRSESTPSALQPQTKEFTIEGSPFKYSPASISVKSGDKVKITFKNTAGRHDLTMDEFNVKTKVLEVGKEETIEFVADKKGEFKYYCSVPGHRAQGMEGTLTVE